jgi:hypothetical protein
VLAADLQRDSLTEPATRWSLHGLREEFYAATVLISTELGEAGSAAQIAETGRADVLNHVLTTPSGRRAATIAAEQLAMPGPDPELTRRIFEVGRMSADAIRSGRLAHPSADASAARTPSAGRRPERGWPT